MFEMSDKVSIYFRIISSPSLFSNSFMLIKKNVRERLENICTSCTVQPSKITFQKIVF